MMSFKDSFFSFLSGLGIGGALGVLLAPESGKESRAKLIYKLNQSKNYLENLVKEISSRDVSMGSNEAKEKSENLIQKTVKRATDLMKEVDSLRGEIMGSSSPKEKK